MKQFLKKLMLGVVTLAMFCCVTPMAFAADPNYYTIYLEPQGGTGVSTQVFVYQSSGSYRTSSLPTPTRDGYSFDGWFDDIVGGNKIDKDYKFTSDGQTIYAQWTATSGSSTSDTKTQEPAQSDKTFKLQDHLGTIVVAGTTILVITLVAMNG